MINAQKIKMLLHARIGPAQIDGDVQVFVKFHLLGTVRSSWLDRHIGCLKTARLRHETTRCITVDNTNWHNTI